MEQAPREHWVFGYGSLMWRPGFLHAERARARVSGRRRAFCIYSVHHRGTPARKGLVLGLAPGGSTVGIAYRVAETDWADVHDYLVEREQPTETYVEAHVAARLWDGRTVRALTFLSDRTHPQWAGVLSLETQARLIAGASGLSGRNIDYLSDLVGHLRKDGVRDPAMEALLARAQSLEREGDKPASSRHKSAVSG